jgi:hypothetical protein
MARFRLFATLSDGAARRCRIFRDGHRTSCSNVPGTGS